MLGNKAVHLNQVMILRHFEMSLVFFVLAKMVAYQKMECLSNEDFDVIQFKVMSA